MKVLVKKIVNGLLARLESYNSRIKLSWFKTLYFNFRTMPFRQAVKMPVFIYGKMTLMPLMGRVQFNCTVKKGMVKIGRNTDCFSASKRSALIYMAKDSRLVFDGVTSFSIDNTFYLREGAELHFGYGVRVGAGVKFMCEESIQVGDFSIITFDSQLLDSNFHYTINTRANSVTRNIKPVKIGKFNWIGNKTSIMPGTSTPDYTIVASNSLINKDYTAIDDSKTSIMLAGSPAKHISSGLKFVFSLEHEAKLRTFFMTNPNIDIFIFDKLFVDKPNDILSFF